MATYTAEQKQAWKEEQQAKQKQMLEDAVARFMDSEKWTQWVRVGRANLSRLTFTNALLIWSQNPEATTVWGKGQWQKLGVELNEDATPLRYFAPVFGIKYEDGSPVIGDDGKPVKVLKFFRTVEGYDIEDTNADRTGLKQHVAVEGDDLIDYLAPLESFARELGIVVTYVTNPHQHGGMQGYLEDGRLILDKDAPANTLVVDLVRELAKVYGDINWTDYSPEDAEVMVEAAAIMTLAQAGYDMSNVSVPYIAAWSNGDLTALKKYVNTIDDLVKTLTKKMGV